MDSEAFSYGQVGVVKFLLQNTEDAISSLESCKNAAKAMKNYKLELDTLLCLGIIYFDLQNFKHSWDCFSRGQKIAKLLKEKEVEEACLCNVGIAMGNQMVLDMQKNFNRQTEEESESEN